MRETSVSLGVKFSKYRLLNGLKQACDSLPPEITIISTVDTYQRNREGYALTEEINLHPKATENVIKIY